MSSKHNVNRDFYGEISELVVNADRPAAFLESICDYMHAECGAIWSNRGTNFSVTTFVLRAVNNRPQLEPNVGRLTFDLEDRHIVAAMAFQQRRPIVGTLGDEPFGIEWLSKTYTADLTALGVKHIVVIPVFDIRGRPQNCLSLYFMNAPDIDISELQGMSRLFSATTEAIDSRLNALRLERSKDRHEVMAHVGNIERKVKSVATFVGTLVGTSDAADTAAKRLADVSRSVSALRRSYSGTGFKQRVSLRMSDSLYVDLRSTLAEISQSSFRAAPSYRAGHAPGSIIMDKSYDILFHYEDLVTLLGNIFGNAYKYAAAGSSIRVKGVTAADFLRLTVTNDVNIELSDDLDSIWDYGTRGESALASKVPGEGLGLGLVGDICDVYDIGFEAVYETVAERTRTKLFHISLNIPENILRLQAEGI